ncbi:DUF262 domain-containing HNH endonuclease family protein [Candidatus Spongiihabitans sp.]|uniref:DUF262 domain-containing HNH endonuclease family protein n=1 Tax=Candidatus Spongiihabitans sp. TaxID=3101308 RepID=UPI003C7AD883
MTDIFKAEVSSFYETMKCHNDSAGYRIPSYQRDYDWGHEHINRLIADCLDGFYRLSESKDNKNNNNSDESFTFLGTLILVVEKEKDVESTFDAVSLSVVDGQQRLTTLVLIACALIENVSIKLDEILPEVNDPKFIDEIGIWIKKETDYQLNHLHECAIGQLSGRDGVHPYPRIVREEQKDKRGRGGDSDYHSAIAKFLKGVSKYYRASSSNGEGGHKFPQPDEKLSEALSKNYKYIQEKIEKLSASSEDSDTEDGTEFRYVKAKKFAEVGVKELFGKTNTFSSERVKGKALSFVSTNNQIEPLVRLLLFASYLTRYVVLTRVETKNDNVALDIFDSLNTTGEPLTAIQTLKPLTIKFDRGGFNDTRPEYNPDAYDQIMEHVHSEDPVKRQNESKELVVLFALYIEGEKISKSLSVQRIYLRNSYLKIPKQAKNPFIESLAEVATFRHHCWDKEGIDKNKAQFSPTNRDEIQLCLRFIADMKTSLAIPILCRYWSQSKQAKEEDNFLKALKALTAFIVIRRAATGGTAGIDSVLRSLMEKTPAELELEFEGDPLSTGLEGENTLWSVENLKVALRGQLKKKVPGVSSKQDWINEVRKTQLAAQSQPLARFMLLAAADGAAADPISGGLWTRKNIRQAEENEYLNYKKWTDKNLSTLEHVAPVANPGEDKWNSAIYENQYTKHTLGNLLLLPRKENASIGNEGWKKKRFFYMALTEKTKDGLKNIFMEADKKGSKFRKQVEEMLQGGERLQFLDPMRDVDDWNEELIRKRTENIADLAWDTIEDWLWKH